jgi:hypothetical protein
LDSWSEAEQTIEFSISAFVLCAGFRMPAMTRPATR